MLEGLKIIEFASYIAAPGAGGIMTDWGAEVIKIEQPGGDPIRGSLTVSARTSQQTRSLNWTIAASAPWCWTPPSPLAVRLWCA